MTMQGDELKALRKSAQLTQAQLADAIGMSRKTIGEMENGAAPIERRTEQAVRYVHTVAGGNTYFSMARRCEDAANGGPPVDREDLLQIAEWLDRYASLPRDWETD